MSGNQIVLIVVPLLIPAFLLFVYRRIRSVKKRRPEKVHGPHTPGAGYDRIEITRSRGQGTADGGVS